MRLNRPAYIRYPGGKSKSLRIIEKYVPSDFSEYREPFLGGGSVFLMLKRRYPQKKFWINDLNSSLFAFWKTAQEGNKWLVKQLLKMKEETSDANGDIDTEKVKDTFVKCRSAIVHADERKRAVFFYYLNKCSFSGLTENGTCSTQAWTQNFGIEGIKALSELEELLRGVKITNLDYTDLLEGSKEIFTFFDPPYDLSKQNASLYGRNGALHKGFDHQKFFEDVKKCQQRFLITYNDNQLIRSLADGLDVSEEQLRYTMRQTGPDRDKSKMGAELFIRNWQ